MSKFFYKYWWLYYILLFSLLGLLIYSLLWKVNFKPYQDIINKKNTELVDARESLKGKDRYIKNLEEQLAQCNLREKQNTVQCNAKVESGGQGMTETTHNLGNSPGRVVVNFDMMDVPDKIEVIYNGEVVATSTNFVSGQGNLSFNYQALPGQPNSCIVKMSAPEDGTIWEYVVNCPQ
ncbi:MULTISPECIES: hypothetical protein [Weeksellaceae]|uniref:Uncharacterized protein n=1 Tax=Algoriella xinjiangensis TaxID=684065 RepID=A0A1I4XRN5_9FLAO|nr:MULTISPECIES: hypothetical protein [Weeksellaceae]SFN28356.1 hypothetical protein SAMN05421738_109139 [Algoriella xinjiangensis]